MKRYLIAFGILICSSTVYAQPSFGVHANGIYASGKEEKLFSDDDFELDNKGRFSWKVGATMNLPLTDMISFMPQLNFLSKGGKFEGSTSETEFGIRFDIDYDIETQLTYLELPLNVVYNTETFFIGLGPSISYGLGGEIMAKYSLRSSDGSFDESESETNDVKFDDDEDADHFSLKALELGANFIAGYKFANGLFINAQFNLGLNNISPYQDTEYRNRYIGVGIGYTFGGGFSARKK